jgi:hypothetical protein
MGQEKNGTVKSAIFEGIVVRSGKFQEMIWPTIPTGSRRV